MGFSWECGCDQLLLVISPISLDLATYMTVVYLGLFTSVNGLGREDITLEKYNIFFSFHLFDFDLPPLLIVLYVGMFSVLSGGLCFGSTGNTGNRSHAAEIKMGSMLGNCCGRAAGNFEGETASFSHDISFLKASSNHTT